MAMASDCTVPPIHIAQDPAQPEDQSANHREQERGNLRILLAEDNIVNQEVAQALLAKKGHTVVTVCDGKQAVNMYQNDHFDLILMDVHMPEMDGFEATSEIRAIERDSGNHVPIVALTANAMQGDRDLCIRSGMDAYIAKPINSQELFRIIESLVLSPYVDIESQTEKADSRSVIDWAEALENLEGDSALLMRLIGLFIQDSSRILGDMYEAIINGDGERLHRSAHTLKGASSNISATAINKLARTIEAFGQDEDFEAANKCFKMLEREIAMLKPLLEQNIEESSNAYINS